MKRLPRLLILSVVALSVIGCGNANPKPKVMPPKAQPTTQIRSEQVVAPVANKMPESDRLVDEGFKALNLGALDIALDAFTLARSKDATNDRAHLGRSLVFTRMAQKQARSPQVTHNIVKQMRELWRHAAESAAAAVKLQPANPTYQLQLGTTLYHVGNPKQAQHHLETAVKHKPSERGHWYLGHIHRANGHPNKAMKSWRAGTRVNPKFGPNFVALGALYVRWDAPAQALKVLQVAAKHMKQTAQLTDIYYYLGLAYGATNRNKDAIKAFEKSLQYTVSGQARFQLGLALLANRNWKFAAKQFSLLLNSQWTGSIFDRSQALRGLAAARAKVTMRPGVPAKANVGVVASNTLNVPKPMGPIRSPRELRLLSGKYLNQDVTVKGVVTWVYDCMTVPVSPAARRGLTNKMWKRKIKNTPSLCWKPHFRLGDAATTANRSITIADVPRTLRKDERRRMTREDLAAYLATPEIAVGDHVTLTGRWTKRSRKGFTNSRGLLQYKSVTFHNAVKHKAHQRTKRRWNKLRKRLMQKAVR